MRRLAAALLGVVVFLAGCALLVEQPLAEFDVVPLVIYAGDRVDLDASRSSGDLVDYRWDVAGAVEHGRTLTTSFARPGIYEVRLTIEDTQGRTAESRREVTVYARSGTRLFTEEFSDGAAALGRWPLDPTWAIQGEGSIESVAGGPGYVLSIHSARETLHRRAMSLDLPPLRIGQSLVFSVRVLAVETQDQHTFLIAPGRASLDLSPMGFAYYVFSSTYGGSAICAPSRDGTATTHPVMFAPAVHEWHTYTLKYAPGTYELAVDGTVWQSGVMDADPSAGGASWLVLGDESLTEACDVYYDSIAVSVEE